MLRCLASSVGSCSECVAISVDNSAEGISLILTNWIMVNLARDIRSKSRRKRGTDRDGWVSFLTPLTVGWVVSRQYTILVRCCCFRRLRRTSPLPRLISHCACEMKAGRIITNAVLEECTPEFGDIGLNAYVMGSFLVALPSWWRCWEHVIVSFWTRDTRHCFVCPV